MFLELQVVILMKNCIIQIFGCNVVRFSVRRCKWRIFCAEKWWYLNLVILHSLRYHFLKTTTVVNRRQRHSKYCPLLDTSTIHIALSRWGQEGKDRHQYRTLLRGILHERLTRKLRICRDYNQTDLGLRRLLDYEYGNGLSWHRILSNGHGRYLDSCISPTITSFRPYSKLHFLVSSS
jgi:hypothetical protein